MVSFLSAASFWLLVTSSFGNTLHRFNNSIHINRPGEEVKCLHLLGVGGVWCEFVSVYEIHYCAIPSSSRTHCKLIGVVLMETCHGNPASRGNDMMCVCLCVCAQQLERYSSPLSLWATSAFLYEMAHWERNPN